jgi:hypothetical protein
MAVSPVLQDAVDGFVVDLLDLRVRRRTAMPDVDRRESANGVLRTGEDVNRVIR